MQKRTSLFCATVLLVAASAVAAQVGHVKTVTGEAFVVSAGQRVAAVPGTPIHLGDEMRTGTTGSMGVTLRDNTMLSFGPSTVYVLEQYLFDPAKGDLLLGGSITAGTLHYVSGAIARLKPDAVKIKTPSGIIGVRGTRFVAVAKDLE